MTPRETSKDFKKLNDNFAGFLSVFFSNFLCFTIHHLIMDESSWQVGCVNVTMSVLLIISRISDHLGPGAPEPESSPLTALAPDTLQIQSRVQSLRGTGLFSTSSQQTKLVTCEYFREG